MTQAIQVVTTVGSREEAQRIAESLISARLAACVQVIGPIASIYRWQGKLETSQEWLCTIKALRANYAALEAAIRATHSYQVPEILAFEVADGSRNYLDWLDAEASPTLGP
jgi:periplasmic divalent cation tolerance protein